MVKQIKVVIKNSEVNCCGVYSIENNTLTVKKGSVIRSQCSPSFKYQEKRVKQIEKCCTIETGITVVTKDTKFVSPTAAANFCMGYESNGLLYWKTEDKRKLKDVLKAIIDKLE